MRLSLARAPRWFATLSLLAAACEPPAPQVAPTPPPSAPAATSAHAAAPLPPEDAAPTGRLPADVTPLRQAIALTVVPDREGFEGTVDIDVDLTQPRAVLWLHARDLTLDDVTLTRPGAAPLPLRATQATPDGVVGLRAGVALAPGKATLHAAFRAKFREHDNGLYRVKAAGDHYAFTQLEDIHAREAFPSFDEPGVKIPYTLTLTVKADHRAVANTREIGREDAGDGLVRVRFAPTEPLPSYLVAFAVGPLDVVDAPPVAPNAVRSRPVPLRGVATRGRGRELAYALAHTGEILSVLEAQIGIAYPYDKLDVIAVPDKGGAMENPGAVTFSEYLLLVDEATAPVGQKRAFAQVMAHELAHQWFGDYVTNVWWDDIWLNEAFASWMGPRATQLWRADTEAEVFAFERVAQAMSTDALTSARSIRQPIVTSHDIRNAFDEITYQKGSGVISMFERWVGRETFRKGIRGYLEAHRMGTATADDLMKALSSAAGRDVATPFRTFLDQPGVPLVKARVVCDKSPRLELEQSRYFPIGSQGDAAKTWQIPVCARFGAGKQQQEACTLLTSAKGSLPLTTCPDWVHPNAEGAGYYRFVLPRPDLERLEKRGLKHLSVREKMSLAQALRAGFALGTTPSGEVFEGLSVFAVDPSPNVADEPMGLFGTAHEWLHDDARLVAKIEARSRALYARRARDLSWAAPAPGADPQQAVLRQRVLAFLAVTGHDPAVRAEARRRGLAYLGIGGDGKIHPEAVDPELVGLALSVTVEDGDAALWGSLLTRLASTEDALLRGRLIGALASTRDPALAARARELSLDARLRVGETLAPLWQLMGNPVTRPATWAWVQANLDRLVARVSPARAGSLPHLAGSFCDRKALDEVQALFGPRIDQLDGGPRVLQSVLESIRLCVAKRDAQQPSMKAYFSR